MKKLMVMAGVLALVLASCNNTNNSEYKALQAQNDSLMLVNVRAEAELNDILGILNEVEDNFQSIKSAENYLSVQSSQGGELTPSTRDRISSDMRLIAETLQKNKEQIEKLEKQVKNSNIQSSEFKKTVERLRAELADKTEALTVLQAELARKDARIAELSESVAALSVDVDNLKSQTEGQQEVIKQQSELLKTVYYCFGTNKELKEQKILVKGEVGTDFNKNYFIREKNPEALTEIPTMAKKAKIVSKHPNGTYEIVKDENNKAIVKILDTDKFWSLTKYLVIEVNV